MFEVTENMFAWGITFFTLGATIAFWLDEYRVSVAALGLTLILMLFGGEAWLHGFVGALLFSPLLFIVLPVASMLKRRLLRQKRQQWIVAEMKVKATRNPEQDAMRPPLTSEKREATAAQRKAENDRKRAEHRAQQTKKMERRLQSDPISAVLRPQVPIRFEETPRSWLGGLPQMPIDIAWPRAGQNGTPLNFAAQICCEDLPAELWRGKGPREGWLLLFIDGFRADGDYQEEGTAWSAVLHVSNLGPERAAPDGLNPVQDIEMSGAHYDDALDLRDVPTVWRKWPIDIIPQRIELVEGKVVSFQARDFALSSTTTKELYGIESNENKHLQLDPDQCPPLTWGGALSFVKMAIKAQRKHASSKATDYTASSRSTPGWVAAMICEIEIDLKKPQKALDIKAPRLRAYETAMKANDSQALAELDASDQLKYPHLKKDVPALEKRIAEMKRTMERLKGHVDSAAEQALSDEITANAAGTPGWWANQGPKLEAIMDTIAKNDPDTQLPAEEWAALYAQIARIRREVVHPERRYDDGRKDGLSWRMVSAVDRAWTHMSARKHYLHLYAHSPALRDLIPAETQENVAKIARAINWGRPHRMGGLADPLQGDIGPDDPPLLFQIASDDALNWTWGDAGAIYIRTSEAELLAREFQGIGYLECH